MTEHYFCEAGKGACDHDCADQCKKQPAAKPANKRAYFKTLQDWREIAGHATIGDMVHDILSDWEAQLAYDAEQVAGIVGLAKRETASEIFREIETGTARDGALGQWKFGFGEPEWILSKWFEALKAKYAESK